MIGNPVLRGNMRQLWRDIHDLTGRMRSDRVTRLLARRVRFAYLLIAIAVLLSEVFGVNAVVNFFARCALSSAEFWGVLLGAWIVVRFSTWPLIRAIWAHS